MKKSTIITLALAFLSAYLFHSELPGLNLFILSIILIPTIGLRRISNLKKSKWWFAAGIFLTNGFSVFYSGYETNQVLYLLSLLYFVAISNSNIRTFYFLVYHTLQSTLYNILTQIVNFLESLQTKKTPEGSQNGSVFKKSLLFFIPGLFFILFLQLYRFSSAHFMEISDFINFNWISSSWIVMFLTFYILFRNWIYFKENRTILAFEKKNLQAIKPCNTDGFSLFLGKDIEIKLSIIIISTLSLLLSFLIISDFSLITSNELQTKGLGFISNELHNGIDSLIFSIILTVIIVTIILRGNLNFNQPKIKALAQLWLILNLLIVVSTFYKNMVYVDLGGLTYKRIGVFIYLTLTFTGILFTMIKIYSSMRFFYLIRTTSIAFFAIITLTFSLNWDVLITNYNLSDKFDTEEVDFIYLLQLSDRNLHLLKEYADNNSVSEISSQLLDRKITNYTSHNGSWKSMVYSFEIMENQLFIRN